MTSVSRLAPMRHLKFIATVALLTVLSAGSDASAQGLIWNLPEDGTWIRYEGTYKQVNFRPDSSEGDLTFEWLRHVTIKSVGTEAAEYQGESVPCRWVEIKVVTGTPAAGIDPGPAGTRIYKVLIPEKAVIGKLTDEKGIPVSFLPIIKGYRKLGVKEEEPLKSLSLEIYPLISPLRHYRQLQAASEQAEDPQVGLPSVAARRYTATDTLENPTDRTLHDAVLWRSADVPFGLARWTVKIAHEKKAPEETRDAFKPVSEVTVEMKAQEVGRDARSELAGT